MATVTGLDEQRRLGKFETPKQLAEFIVKWAIRKGDDLVLEPCVGSGVLLFEAIKQLEEFQPSDKAFRNIYGVDVDPAAIDNVKIKLGLDQDDNSNFVCMDFLKTTPNKDVRLVDVVICNPPYTRHQSLKQNYKNEIANEFEENIGLKLSRQSGIYVYFLIHAAQFLKKNGRMGFVLPSNFLDVNYGTALKRFLVNNFETVIIILFPREDLQFHRVLTTTCIVLLERQQRKQGMVSFLRLNLPLDPQELIGIVEKQIYQPKRKAWGIMNNVRQASIDPREKWNKFFHPHIKYKKGLLLLRDLAKVKRGIATGANNFFTLSDDEVQEFDIERKFLKPVLVKARNAPFLDFHSKDLQTLKENGRKVWLLSINQTKSELHGTKLLSYIKMGEMKRFHYRYLTKARQIWYSSEKREPSPIIFTYMNRNRPRFIYNKARILVLNTFHFVYPTDEITESAKLKALLAYLNSKRTLGQLGNIGRFYGGGLLKVEPKELGTLPVLDLHKLEKADVVTLSRLFERLCTCIRKRNGENEVYGEIDQLVDSLEQDCRKKEGQN